MTAEPVEPSGGPAGGPAVDLVRLDVMLAPHESSIHRLLATLHRKRVVLHRLVFERAGDHHAAGVEAAVPAGRAETVVAVLRRDPTVLDATLTPG